jgi:hypothetical protein
MHSVADDESSHDLVDFSTEEAIVAAIDKDEAGFAGVLVDFAHDYGDQAREDHQTSSTCSATAGFRVCNHPYAHRNPLGVPYRST